MGKLTGSDIARAALRTPLLQATWNYERQQGLGWAFCFQPLLERLYPDAETRRRLEVRVDVPASLERAPIETVSLSEAGAERVFQGLETTWSFDVALAGGRPFTVRFGLRAGRPEEAA